MMKKVLRYLLWSLAGLAVLVALVATTIYFVSSAKLSRHYAVTVSPAPVSADPGAIERGRHLALTRGCLHCHGDDLGGAVVVDNALIGRLAGPNLTRGRGGLPPDFVSEDWVRAIRHGLRPEGTPLVLMPSAEFAHFSEADMGALLAFLTSARPVDRDSIPVRLGPLGRVLLVAGKFPLAADLIDHANTQPEAIVPGVTVEYGRYLATSCVGCHGQNLSGGRIPAGPPDWPPASNLTPIAGGPVANWTEKDFIATLRTHRRPDGSELNKVMPEMFAQMTDLELQALWAYVRSVPPSPTGQRDNLAAQAEAASGTVRKTDSAPSARGERGGRD